MPWPYSRPAFFIQVLVQVIKVRFRQIQGSSSRYLKIDLLFCYTYKQCLASTHLLLIPWHLCTWLLFYELSRLFNSGVRIGIRLGRVHRKTIWMVGWALRPSGWYWAFRVPMFLSDLLPLCLWIHSTLFCKQGFAIPTSYIFVLRDTGQTIPLHEYAVHCCQPLLFCSISGTIFLPRSTVSILLSFTLNQASATSSHSIMPSRRNGKFSHLVFVRGCLIGFASLIRFLVLWFMEWIDMKLSTEVFRSLSSILWQAPSLVPAYHSHAWDLPSLKQYFALGPPALSSSCSRYPIPTSTEFFYVMHMALWDYVQHIERNKVFTIDFPSNQAYCWHTPHFFLFFEKDDSSDLWEVVTCFSKLLWMMVWFHCHHPFWTPSLKTAHPYGWVRLAMVHQIFHLDLFSFNLRLAVTFLSA